MATIRFGYALAGQLHELIGAGQRRVAVSYLSSAPCGQTKHWPVVFGPRTAHEIVAKVEAFDYDVLKGIRCIEVQVGCRMRVEVDY